MASSRAKRMSGEKEKKVNNKKDGDILASAIIEDLTEDDDDVYIIKRNIEKQELLSSEADYDEKNKDIPKRLYRRQDIRNKKMNWLNSRTTTLLIHILVLISVFLAAVLAGLVNYMTEAKEVPYAWLRVELIYDGAANGLTPKGTQFAIDGIKNTDIIEKALSSAGYEGKYDADEIKEALYASGIYPNGIIEKIQKYDSLYDFSASREVLQSFFYPTVYLVRLSASFNSNIDKSELLLILESIAKTWKEKFIEENTYAFSVSKLENIIDTENTDYRYQLQIIKSRLETVSLYAGEMYELNSNFKYNTYSFQDYVAKCEALETDYIETLEAQIQLNALSTDPNRLKYQYEYSIEQTKNRIEMLSILLNEMNELIEGYEKDDILYVGTGESYIVVDGNSQETYEALLDKKIEITESITSNNVALSRYTQYLESLQKSTGISAALQDDINDLATRLETIEDEFNEMLNAYNNELVNGDNLIVTDGQYVTENLLSGTFVVNVIQYMIPLWCLSLMVMLVVTVIKDIKKMKMHDREETI